MRLTREDLKKLLADPSEDRRVETVTKLTEDYNQGSLSDSENQLAQEIFRVLLQDAAVRVREALALNLKENATVPHDVAVTLAKDVESVSLPVLEFSEVLSDSDLIEIIQSQNVEKQKAIAGRKQVSEGVSDALVETDNEQVVTRLVANEGAQISEDSLKHVLETLGDNEGVQAALAQRNNLPVVIVEKVMTVMADHFKNELMAKQGVPNDVLTDLILQTWERATISLSGEHDQDQLERLVRHLHDDGNLSHSLLLRALCLGDIRFFETAIAVLADVPIQNARLLIHDSGSTGLETICGKADMPKSFFPAVCAAIAISHETDLDGEEQDMERYKRRMIERILSQYGEQELELGEEDLEYLLAKMGSLPSVAAALH